MGGAGGTPAKGSRGKAPRRVVQEGGSPLGHPLSAAFSVETEKAAPLPAVWNRE